jgi:hypothetical protein
MKTKPYAKFECNIEEAKKIIKESQGAIASCVFRKRTGEKEIRKMVFRTGVRKGVTGVGMSYKPEQYDLLTVYDMQKNEFRHINLRTLVQLRVNGVLYLVKHPKEEK